MAGKSLVQARIDSTIKDRASKVLEGMGLTVSDAVRILLTRTANEGSLPFAMADSAAHDAWFRAKVHEALQAPRAAREHQSVKAHFHKRRESAITKAASKRD